jgi:hypothetical protein
VYPNLVQQEEPDPPTRLLQELDSSSEDDNMPTNKGKWQASNSTLEEDDHNLTIIRHTGIGE